MSADRSEPPTSTETRASGDTSTPAGTLQATSAAPKPAGDELDHFFRLSRDLLCVAGFDGYFKRLNPAWTTCLGWTLEELRTRPLLDFVHPDDRGATRAQQGKVSSGADADLFENRYRHQDGSYRWLQWSARPVLSRRLVYATARDVTQHKQQERALRGMATRLMLAEEHERRRIAHGLHDEVGQMLVAAKLSLGELLDGDVPDNRAASAQELRSLLERAIQATRTLTFALAAPVLYEVGLGAALRSECERAEQESGIRFQPAAGLERRFSLPEETRVVLFRIARELVRNVVTHSRARTATVSLSSRGDRIRLTVEDDGQGFEAATVLQQPDPTAGFGLFSIAQHLESIGGAFEVSSSPAYGTRAEASVPVEATEQSV